MAQVIEKPNDTRFNYKGKILNWKTDMQALSLDELPFVEYRMENTKIFKKLFLKKPGGLCCTVCNTMGMSGKASVNSHLNGKKHLRAIELVVEFRHNNIQNAGPVKPNANTPGKPAGNVVNTPAKSATGAITKPQGVSPVVAKPTGSPVSVKPAGSTPVAAKPAGSTPVAAKPEGSTQAVKPAGTVKPSTAVATAKPGTAKPGPASTKEDGNTATPVKAAGAAKPVGTPAPKAKPAGTPIIKPAGTPVSKPAGTPLAKPAGTPVAKPAGTPAAKPLGTPAAKPPGTPAGKPAAKPAGTPAAKPAGTPTAKPAGTPTAKPAGTPTAKPAGTPTAKPAGSPTAKPPATPTGKPSGTPQAKPAPKPPGEVTKPVVKAAPKIVAKPSPTTPAKPIAPGAATKPIGTPNQTAKATPAKMPAAKPPAAVTSGIAKPTGTATPTNTPAQVTGTATTKPKSTSTVSTEIKMETTAADAPNQEISPIKNETVNFSDDVIITNLSEPEVVDLVSDTEESESPAKPKTGTDTVTPNGKPAAVANDDANDFDLPLVVKQMKTLRSVMHSLGPSDLQLIEYRFIAGNWLKLITKDFRSNYACRLCKKFNMSTVNTLNAHIADDSHKKAMGAVRGIFHPIIAPVKLPPKFLSELTPEPPEVQAEVPVETSKESNEKEYKFTKPVSLLEFKSKHVYLDIEELLKIEYREKSSIWYSLVCKQGTTYKCALCKTPYLGAIKNIIEHLRGKKHLTTAATLTELHHPKYCPASGRPADVIDTEMTDDGGQKSSKVLNPMAVFKNTTNTTAVASKDNVPQGRKVPTRITQHPVGSQVNKRQPIATHPGLQPQLPTNQPSFAAKTITSKPETDDKLEGYIGVEYVIKILENAQDSNPRFECSLCELETHGDGMQAHLKSSAHRLKYLDRHFRTCMREFEQYRKDVSCRNMLAEIARRISVAVEKHHGRDLPFECLKDEYRLNRPEIMSKVFSFRHASEYSGPSMIHVIDKATLNELYSNRHKIPAQVAAENKRRTTFDAEDGTSAKRYRMDTTNVENKKPQAAAPLDVDEHRRLVDQFLRSTNRDGLMDRRARRSRSRGRERHGRGRRSRSRSMGRRRSRSRSGDAWSTYKRLFDHSIRDLETDYKRYERDPETHPLYQKEWKIFWQKRSEELASDGRDPTSYDFQPEWILFWTRRMDQIHEEEIDTLKRKLRDRLNLPYHNHELRDERYHIGNQRKPQSAFSQIRQSIDTKGNVPPGNMEPPGGGPHAYNDTRFDMNPMDQMPAGMGLGPGPFEMPQQNMGTVPFDMPPQNMGSGPFNMPSQNFGPFNMDSFGMSQNINVPTDGMMQPFPIQQRNMMPHRMGGGDLPPMNTNLPDIMPRQNMPASLMGNNNMNQTRRNEKQVVDRTLRQLSGNQAQQPGRLNENPKPPGNFAANVAVRKPEPSVQIQQQPPVHENIRDNSRQKEQQELIKKKPSQRERSPPDDDDPIESGPLNIVSVLRLLTALEDNLGILGPRVIDLMARALQLEKSNLGSADRILLTQENTVFLETVREKLRGQIVVGVLDVSKTRAVNQAIKDVTTLLNKGILNDGRTPIIEKVHVSKSISSIVPKPPQISASTSTSNNATEKRELASKLAAVLAAQGKTNVNSDQLEQLIAVYTLIEKKQRENEPKQQSLSDLLVDSLKVSSSYSTEDSRNIGINNNDNFSGTRQDNNYLTEQQSRSSSSQQQQQQKQKQFDRISQFSNPSNPNVSQGSMNMGSFNRKETNQFSGSGSSNQFSGSGSSNQFSGSGSSNQFSGSGSSNQFSGSGSSNQPSWKSSSYSFGLSNFDTSLSLPSISMSYNRNSDNNRQNQQQQEETQQNNLQNTPVYMTNIGRTNRNNDTQQQQQQQKDMVAYPSVWQRSGTVPGRIQSIANQKTPLGWQQNQNNSNNRNRGRR